MSKKLILITVLFGLISCRKSQNFYLTNNSKTPVENVRIYTSSNSSNLHINSLSVGSSKNHLLNMENENLIDGIYYIEYKHKNMILKDSFGYFTNGGGSGTFDIYFNDNSIEINWQKK